MLFYAKILERLCLSFEPLPSEFMQAVCTKTD